MPGQEIALNRADLWGAHGDVHQVQGIVRAGRV